MSRRMEGAVDWDEFKAWMLAIAAVGILFWAMIKAGKKEEAQRSKFMSQCMAERKEYECDAMWGQARGAVFDAATSAAIR